MWVQITTKLKFLQLHQLYICQNRPSILPKLIVPENNRLCFMVYRTLILSEVLLRPTTWKFAFSNIFLFYEKQKWKSLPCTCKIHIMFHDYSLCRITIHRLVTQCARLHSVGDMSPSGSVHRSFSLWQTGKCTFISSCSTPVSGDFILKPMQLYKYDKS